MTSPVDTDNLKARHGNPHAVRLRSPDGTVTVIIHPSTKPGYKRWQVSYFNGDQHLSDSTFDDLNEACQTLTSKGFVIDRVS